MTTQGLCTDRICASVILYNPDRGDIARIPETADIIGKLIIVDNGSDPELLREFQAQLQGEQYDWLLCEDNPGVGEALNQAARRARKLGYQWMLTLDQDSEVHPNLVEILQRNFDQIELKDQIVILAPAIEFPELETDARFLKSRFFLVYERAKCSHGILEDVTIAITSGSLTNLDILDRLGGYRSDFFIDYIDTEFCLRSRAQGYKIVAVCNAHIIHRLGHRIKKEVGPFRFFPTFHLPLRWYYISRNRIPMIRMYGLKFPHWLSFEIISSLYIFFRMMLFEDHRGEKLKAIFYGTLDGLRGRMGKIRPELESKLQI